MRLIAAAVLVAGGVGLGSVGDAAAQQPPQCFDKGLLQFVDCPQPAPPPPAPIFAPPETRYNWSGAYVGAHLGYADLRTGGGYDLDEIDGLQGRSIDAQGIAYGGQVGYLEQFGDFVAGVEIDASLADADDDVGPIRPAIDAQTLGAAADSFGSIRARLGYAVDTAVPLMPYLTAGVGLVDYEANINDVTDIFSFDSEEFAVGGVLGGGLETAITDNITLRGEGLLYLIGDEYAFIEPGSAQADGFTVEDLWTARAAINWKF